MPGPAQLSLPVARVTVDAQAVEGPLETWRHALGHGGVNPLPLPDGVVKGVRKLRPRLIRIFIQEFFRIYPRAGRFDWSRLDPYMDALARTGAKVVAAITIKPEPLYPKVDQSAWRPGDVKAWQQVVRQLVLRYSVRRPIVTHWEIGNEVDIGEDGGCPYLIPDPKDYADYYAMTIAPILEAFPRAKVGGPANAYLLRQPLPGFVGLCRQRGLRLDFVSWHLYHSDPALHAFQVEVARLLTEPFGERRCELMVTEWNRRLGERVSVEDRAFDPRRAAAAAAIILATLNARLDWSFYYHIWDQTCFREDFAPFFSPRGVKNMIRHWNEIPHRLGLFSVSGEVRPQYFVYQMLARMGSEKLAARSDDGEVRVLAGRGDGRVAVMLVNYSLEERCDRAAALHLANLPAGPKRLTVCRLDDRRRWRPESLELEPVERREISTAGPVEFHVLLPADSVALVTLEALPADRRRGARAVAPRRPHRR
jgi:hypothetical protein